MPDDPDAPPVVREPIEAGELAERIRAAARRTARIGRAVDHELGVALPLLARALTGTGDGIPAIEVLPPSGPLTIDSGDRAAFDAIADELLSTFEQWLGAAASHWTLATADELLEFAFTYGDGRLGEWTRESVEAFLLEYLPARGTLDPAEAEAVPGDLLTFLRFLSEGEMLDGDPLGALEAAVAASRAAYAEAYADPRRFGPAKTMIMQMRSEGVDLTDQAALERWSEEFNARPYAERDRILGASLGAGPAGSSPNRSTSRPKRKATKRARKRNRR